MEGYIPNTYAKAIVSDMKANIKQNETGNCIGCEKEFKTYIRTVVCSACDGDGSIEVEAEFGEGSSFKGCFRCGGKGEYEANEKEWCSEECIEDYFSDEKFFENFT